MAQESFSLDGLAQLHPTVGDLSTLLDQLRRQDHLTIGSERAQNAAALLARLAEQGVRLDQVEAAAAWLGPVLCVTARERRALEERLRRANPEIQAPQRRLPPMPSETLLLTEVRTQRRQTWIAGGATAVVLALIVLLVIFGGANPIQPFGSDDASTTVPPLMKYLIPGLGALAGLSGLALRLWRRPMAVDLPPPADPPPIGQGLAWFDEGILQGPLRLMGGRRSVSGRWLDLPRSIQQTVRAAGWPTLVRGGRPRTPEHLLLVHLSSADDPQMLVAAALLDRLRATDLRVTVYSFFGVPNWLYPWQGGEPEPLSHVAAKQAGARLLLLSDGSPFYDPFASQARPLIAFQTFPVHVLITPLARVAWGWREAALDRGGWHLAEQSTESIADLARWLAGPRESAPLASPERAVTADLPTHLVRDASLFADDPPPETIRQTLRDDLAQWLDPDPRKPPNTYDLLCCLAVGFRLSPGTVERVIAHVAALGGPRADEDGLRRLLRLPWFARGGISPWLRDDLLRDMAPALRTVARQAWLLHLADVNPDHGRLPPDQEATLETEVRLRLAHADSMVDPGMRVALGLDALPPPGLDWRRAALSVALAIACAVALPMLYRFSGYLPAVVDALFRPLTFFFGRSRDTLAILAPALAAASTLGGSFRVVMGHRDASTHRLIAPVWPDWQQRLITLVPLYIALGLWWISRHDDVGPAVWSLRAGSILATFGLVVPELAKTPPGTRIAARSLIGLGHPWANALAVLLLAGLGQTPVIYDDLAQALTMTTVIATTLGALIGVFLLARLLAPRLINTGQMTQGAVWVIALHAAAVATFAVGAMIALLGLVGNLLPFQLLSPQMLVDGAVTAAILAMVWPVRPIAWGRLALGCLAYVALTAAMTLISTIGGWFDVLSFPARLVVAGGILYRPRVRSRWGWVAAILVFDNLVATPTLSDFFPSIADAARILLVWPFIRAIRPDLVVPSDGLWRSCLPLLLCWISITVAGVAIGPFPVLGIPLAAWIAARHGTRSLPAIALALLPMVVRYTMPVDGVTVTIGGNLAQALAALLVARFAADRAFRESCMAATRISRWQVVALALVPLSYASPEIYGFEFFPDPWTLPLTVAALLGLSQVPLRWPLMALVVSSLAGFIFSLVVIPLLPFHTTNFGSILHGLRDVPADTIAVLLAFGLFRTLIAGPRQAVAETPLLGWVLPSIRQRPLLVALTVAPIAFATDLLFQRSSGETFNGAIILQPFLKEEYLLLALFWAAAGIHLVPAISIRIAGRAIPGSALLAAVVLLIATAPTVGLTSGWITARLFGYGPAEAIGTFLTIYGFARMGAALAPLLPAMPTREDRTHPAFDTLPVRIGIGLVALPCLAAAAFVAVLISDAVQSPSSPPAPVVQPTTNPAQGSVAVPASPTANPLSKGGTADLPNAPPAAILRKEPRKGPESRPAK
jgi:hypothetical protein